MPVSCARLLDNLALPSGARTFKAMGAEGRLEPGTEIPEPKGVFPRWIDPEEAARRAAEGAAKPAKKDGKKAK
jgi:methionyl-tRNA synthetase